MSLRDTVSILREPTIALSAGTAVTWTNTGKGTNGVNVLVDVADTDLTTRRSFQTRLTDAALPPNTGANATLGRAEVKAFNPVVYDGKQYKRPMGAYITFLPTDTPAIKTAIRKDLVSMIMDAEMDNLFLNGVNN